MILIDHISFEFTATNEKFAHQLYADWDRFCRDCFEKIVEECLSSYDKDRVLHEIELLELDLGSIPEEDFYREFPRRLKEELFKVLPSWNIQTEDEKKKSNASRLENLLFYLEHGYQKSEWADNELDLTEELNWALSQQGIYTEMIVNLCMKKEYTLRRILWQTNDEGTEMITLVATHLSADCLLQSIARVDFRQAAVLSQTVDWLQRKASRFSFLTGNNMPLSTALSKALLLFIQDEDTLGGRILTEKEVIDKLLSYLHFVYTGKADFQSNAEWTNVTTCIIEENKSENTVNMKNEELNIPDEANNLPVSEQSEICEVLFISNAGLCLLSPWLPRLFDMLGYLGENKRDFKDMASRIRTVFLLQYFISSEEKEYREIELAFNRLLVGLPMYVPLPKRMELTAREKQTADSLLSAVKSNWPKMNGTSTQGFQQCFIARTGHLEQQESKWLLTVDNRAFDILIESIPWGFRQIRFPWIKKCVQVIWHEK